MRASCRACLLRFVCLKRMTLMRALVCVLLLSVVTSLFFSYHIMNFGLNNHRRTLSPPRPEVSCPLDPDVPPSFTYEPKEHSTKERYHLGRRALIIVETQYTRSGTSNLSWDNNSMSIIRKCQQRLHFLRQLKRLGLNQKILAHFYRLFFSYDLFSLGFYPVEYYFQEDLAGMAGD